MAHPATSTIDNIFQLFERVSNEMTDEEVLQYLQSNHDLEEDKELNQIKIMRAKALAQERKDKFAKAKEKLKRFLDANVLAPARQQQAQVMYRKLQHIEGDDQQQLAVDEKLLDFISELDDNNI